jgi:hypothetical protein
MSLSSTQNAIIENLSTVKTYDEQTIALTNIAQANGLSLRSVQLQAAKLASVGMTTYLKKTYEKKKTAKKSELVTLLADRLGLDSELSECLEKLRSPVLNKIIQTINSLDNEIEQLKNI